MLRYGLVLAIVLAIYWFALSFYTIPLIVAFGVISVLLVIGLCARMKILDEETVPYLFTLPTAVYLFWLGKEIVKANVQVVKAVLSPDMEISPTMVKIPSTPRTEIGKTMFGNSITLTPGTVTVEMEEDEILVHALLTEMSDPKGFEDMAARAAWAVGETQQRPNGDDS